MSKIYIHEAFKLYFTHEDLNLLPDVNIKNLDEIIAANIRDRFLKTFEFAEKSNEKIDKK